MEPIFGALSTVHGFEAHSIRDEWDCTSPWVAQFLGQRGYYECQLADLGVCSNLVLDKRQWEDHLPEPCVWLDAKVISRRGVPLPPVDEVLHHRDDVVSVSLYSSRVQSGAFFHVRAAREVVFVLEPEILLYSKGSVLPLSTPAPCQTLPRSCLRRPLSQRVCIGTSHGPPQASGQANLDISPACKVLELCPPCPLSQQACGGALHRPSQVSCQVRSDFQTQHMSLPSPTGPRCPLSQRAQVGASHCPTQVAGQALPDVQKPCSPVTLQLGSCCPLSQRVRSGASHCPPQAAGQVTGTADGEHVGSVVPHKHPDAAPVGEPTPKRPTDLQVLLAENLELLPDTIRGPFKYNPVGSIPALLVGEGSTDDTRFTVFDPLFHYRGRRRGRDWSIIDCAADAVSATPTRVRSIQVILRPIAGLPVPQLTLCPAHTRRPNFVLPVDLRSVGYRICTVVVAPGDAILDVFAQVQEAACGPRLHLDRDAHLLRDASGRLVDVLQEPLSQYEWLRVEPVAPAQINGGVAEGLDGTTTTCTFMEAFPPTLLGSYGLSTDITRPRMLADATLWPRSIGTPIGANIPVAQLNLFPGFGVGAKHTVPFMMFVHGYPAIRLQGASSWSMLDFCRHAAVQIEEPPLSVQFLTSPVPGLSVPQITVTEAGIPQEGIVLPIDLRDVDLEVTPMAVTAGTSLRTLLAQLGAIVPELGPALASHLQHDRVFLQDCHGHVHDCLPAEPQALQWLAIRIGASPFPTPPPANPLPPLPFDVPGLTSTSTTTTTEMHVARPCVSFVLVCEGVTVRSEVMLASEVNVQQVLVELVRGLAGLSRLNQQFQLTLAPILPRTTAAQHYVVPLLASYNNVGETVFYDPGSDGLQLSSFTVAAGSAPEDALSAAQRRAGFRLRVNGLPTSLCHRPLELGDYLQLVRADQAGAVAHHVAPLLEQIRELRLLTIPLDLPAVGLQLQGDQLVAVTVAQPRPFSDVLRRILTDRAARMGGHRTLSANLCGCYRRRGPHTSSGWILL